MCIFKLLLQESQTQLTLGYTLRNAILKCEYLYSQRRGITNCYPLNFNMFLRYTLFLIISKKKKSLCILRPAVSNSRR